MWCSLGITYFACDPLLSYFNECQKNGIYFSILFSSFKNHGCRCFSFGQYIWKFHKSHWHILICWEGFLSIYMYVFLILSVEIFYVLHKNELKIFLNLCLLWLFIWLKCLKIDCLTIIWTYQQILRTVNWSFTLNNGAKTADPALPNSKALSSWGNTLCLLSCSGKLSRALVRLLKNFVFSVWSLICKMKWAAAW